MDIKDVLQKAKKLGCRIDNSKHIKVRYGGKMVVIARSASDKKRFVRNVLRDFRNTFGLDLRNS